MKKTLSLILALVMIVASLSGITMALEEVPEAEALYSITLPDGTTTYHTIWASETFTIACSQDGETVIKLLKDAYWIDEGDDNVWAQFPGVWDNPETNTVVVDLNGHTMSYDGGPANIFISAPPAAGSYTVKNGTILYNCVGNTRNVVAVGTSNMATSDFMTGELYHPVITLENLEIYDTTTAGGRVLNSFAWGLTVNIKNCKIWTEGTAFPVIDFRASKQGDSLLPYTGEMELAINIEDSIIGSAGNSILKAAGKTAATFKNATFVTNGADVIASPDVFTVTGDAGEAAAWTGTIAGKAVSGTATVYGAVADPVPEVPSTDVPDVEVPKTGVSIAALGILAVTSMAGVVIARKKED